MKENLNKIVYSLISIAVILLLIGLFAGKVLFWGAGFFLIGALILLLVIKKQVKIKSMAMVYGVYLAVYGLILMWAPFLAEQLGIGDAFIVSMICVGLGGLSIITGVYDISKKWLCKVQVDAVYRGAARQVSKGSVYFVPRFAFTYEGKEYENTSGELYGKRKIHKKYEQGKTYPIYISQDNPNIFRTKKAIGFGDVLLFLLGILFCAAIVIAF